MPRYNFHCLACKKQFSEALTLAEYEEDEVICPHCGSDDVESELGAFHALASGRPARAVSKSDG
jgi:putative FmdB family regulatory protein